MLDMTKYELIELGTPNISVAWELSKDRTGFEFGMDKDIEDFINQAAIKFPMWKFVGINHWRRSVGDDTRIEAYRFYVYEDKELLGNLSSEYSRAHGRVYCIENERISNSRERGSAAKTKDMKKAFKLIAKQFGAKTMFERLVEANENCETGLNSAVRMKYINFNGGYNHLLTKLVNHLMANWDQTLSIAMTNGADAKVLENLPSQYEDYKIAEEVQKCFDQKNGAVVTIHGKDYAVKEGDRVTIYGTDDLPEWLKRGVGMLKLVEQQTLIANVGYKIKDQSFFVMKGTDNG